MRRAGNSVGAPRNAVGIPSLDDVGAEFLGLADEIGTAWSELRAAYDSMRSTFASDGMTTPEQLVPYGWSASDQQRATDLGVMASLAQRYLRDAATGARTIWVASDVGLAHAGIAEVMEKSCVSTGGTWTVATLDCACPAGFSYDFIAGGCVDPKGVPHEATWAIEKKPEDVYAIDLDAVGNPVLVNAQGSVAHAPPSNAIGLHPAIVVAGIAVAMYAIIGTTIVAGLRYLRDIARGVEEAYLESKAMECYKPYSGVSQDECDRRVAARRDYQLAKDEAERRRIEAENKGGAADIPWGMIAGAVGLVAVAYIVGPVIGVWAASKKKT